MSDEGVMICPRCKSTDISANMGNYAFASTGLFNNQRVCNSCGYSGMFFPMVDKKELEQSNQNDSESNKPDVTTEPEISAATGNMYAKGIINWWKVSGPLCMLSSFLFVLSDMLYAVWLGWTVLFFGGLLLTLYGWTSLRELKWFKILVGAFFIFGIFGIPLVLFFIIG